MPLYSRNSSNCWIDDKKVLNCYTVGSNCWIDDKNVLNCHTVGMTSDHFMMEKNNRTSEEFADSLLDFLLVMVNIICFISNLAMIIYKRSVRINSNNLE